MRWPVLPGYGSCIKTGVMKPITEKLMELQLLVLSQPPVQGEAVDRVKQLREEVPDALLAHFDRLVAKGRRAVAKVRHGVCDECHMRLPSGVAASLARTDDVVLCETCSCYLMQAPEEIAEQRQLREESRARRLQKIRRALASVD